VIRTLTSAHTLWEREPEGSSMPQPSQARARHIAPLSRKAGEGLGVGATRYNGGRRSLVGRIEN